MIAWSLVVAALALIGVVVILRREARCDSWYDNDALRRWRRECGDDADLWGGSDR